MWSFCSPSQVLGLQAWVTVLSRSIVLAQSQSSIRPFISSRLKFSRRFLGFADDCDRHDWAKGRVSWCLVLSCSGFLPHAHSGVVLLHWKTNTGTPWLGFSSLQVHMWHSARTQITTVSSDTSKEEWSCFVYFRWNLEGGLKESTRISKSKSCLGLEYFDKKRIGKKATPTRLGSAALPFTSLQCPVLVASDDQLWNTGGLYLAVLPRRFSASTCPTSPPLFCDFMRRGFSDFMFVCFLSLAVGLDILNFGRTKR